MEKIRCAEKFLLPCMTVYCPRLLELGQDGIIVLEPEFQLLDSPLELHVSLVMPWWILLSSRRMLSENSFLSDGSSSSRMSTQGGVGSCRVSRM